MDPLPRERPDAGLTAVLFVVSGVAVACAPRDEVPTLRAPGVVVTAPAPTATPAGSAGRGAPADPTGSATDSTASRAAPTAQRGER